MYKLIILMALFLNACAGFTINSTMCDNVGIGSDGQMHNIPQECQDYDKKKAKKAFNKVVDDKKVSKKDIEFNKEQEEE